MNELKNNYEFMTSVEVSKSIAEKIKKIRKKKFKSQELFAKHIGMPFATYARFEKTGQISFKGFIEVLKGVDRLEEIVSILNEDKNIIEW